MKPIFLICGLATTTLLVAWLWSSRPDERLASRGVSARASDAPPPQRLDISAPSVPEAITLPASAAFEIPFEQQMAGRLLALIEAESDPMRREEAAEAGARKIPRALLGPVLALLQKRRAEPGVDVAMRGAMLRWAWEEPTGAAAWTLEVAAEDFRRDALGMVAAGWARLQPDVLRQWAAQLAPAERDWVMLHGASYLARTDLEKFTSWQTTLAPSRERDQLLAQTARLWAGRAPLHVAELITRSDASPQAEWRRHLADALAGQLAEAADPSVVGAVVAALPIGAERDTVLAGLVAGWSTREPDLTATWLDGVQDMTLRAKLSVLLAGNWLQKDPDAAIAWMKNLPASPVAEAVAKRAAEFTAAPPPE